ncbi:MFS transporter [Williamsia sterculiae]|uniref:MFS transporter n=1 Tax=Williamsia sterculiae TaxID=1344003 RepID=UPI00117D41B1|nr:MFS transporter [Williamsia sterculiae]
MAVPVSLVIPPFVARSARPARWLVAFSLFDVAGIVGLLVAPDAAPLLWSITLGLGMSVFSLVMTVVTVRAPSPGTAIAFSGSVQGIGYLIAAVGPYLIGVLRHQVSGWSVPLLALLGIALVQTVIGTRITSEPDPGDHPRVRATISADDRRS